MKKTSIYAALLACSLTFAGAAFQTANAAIVMRAGHDSPETVPVAKGLAKFADLVNERTKGEVQIQVFNNGIVGSASDYAVNCQLGTLDIGAVNQSVMTSFIPDIEAVDIPYLITTYEQADKLFAGDGPLTKYYTEEINNAGLNLVNLDVWEVGFREFSNSTREINTADDIAGIRLRVMDSQVHQGFWKALGADPVAMSWGEAYTALQQKAIDGVENAISVLDGNNINEVNNYLAMTDHNYSAIFIIMSAQTWNKLTPEQQKIVADCAKEAGVYQREEQRRQAEAAVNNLTSKGMKLTHPDKASIEAKVADFLKEQKAKYPEIMKIIDAAK
ncbi:TRAP transporter substrate-binding protein [uncultured Succinatimonas sp.]|uniref:TRAP transporter substrate-binding protein n=1 Tax=uncultured Succinatimonas sp. TaxID=1262973 RepID=UPI0025E131AD|nr:TRAP transporter substrate-binding protein [uncultured Succinatimonas sp.]